jgi:hypothetical protein
MFPIKNITSPANRASFLYGMGDKPQLVGDSFFAMRTPRDLTNFRSGKLTALRFRCYDKNSKAIWDCLCDCGNQISTIASRLVTGKSKSCGCSRKKPHLDYSGKRFGKLIVLRLHEKRTKNCKTYWVCRCECGSEKEISQRRLSNGSATDCGCVAVEKKKNRREISKSDGVYHYLYSTWLSMKGRCYTKSNKAYKHYGGRGIEVCESWRNSFAQFKNDMGERPSSLHSIERIDNNGNYEPSNCRWATTKEQSRNTSRTIRVLVGDAEMVFADAIRNLGIAHWFAYKNMEKTGLTHQEFIDLIVKKKTNMNLNSNLPTGAEFFLNPPWDELPYRLCVFCDRSEILSQEDKILDYEPNDDKAAAMYQEWKDENTHVCERCYIDE